MTHNRSRKGCTQIKISAIFVITQQKPHLLTLWFFDSLIQAFHSMLNCHSALGISTKIIEMANLKFSQFSPFRESIYHYHQK